MDAKDPPAVSKDVETRPVNRHDLHVSVDQEVGPPSSHPGDCATVAPFAVDQSERSINHVLAAQAVHQGLKRTLGVKMPDFAGWAYADLTTTGPDPFSSNATGNSSSVGASTITINSGVSPTLISMTDDDSQFTDGDSGQRFQGPADFNGGVGFDVGDRIETEYSYIVRPQGSSDPADNVTIYMLEIDADGQGIAADGQLTPGVTYDIIAIDSNSPVVDFTSLFVCFASGTLIRTPAGERAVEDLKQGDTIDTLDHGPQRLRWIGRRRLQFEPGPHAQKPILLPANCLGPGNPRHDLVVSPQHRILLHGAETADWFGHEAVLAPAKSLLPVRGVRQMFGRKSVTYHSLLFDRHQIIHANGLAVESFFPGPYAMSLLTLRQRAQIRGICPALLADPVHGYGDPARPIVPRRHAERLMRRVRNARIKSPAATAA